MPVTMLKTWLLRLDAHTTITKNKRSHAGPKCSIAPVRAQMQPAAEVLRGEALYVVFGSVTAQKLFTINLDEDN